MNKQTFLKPLVMFCVLTLLTSGLVLFAADGKDTKRLKVKKGAEVIKVKGVTRSWSDAAKEPKGKKKMRPVLNFENPRKIVKQTNAVDPVAQTGHNTKGLERGALMPSPDIHFAGMYLDVHGAGWPPDTNGDTGSNYFIQTVNTTIGIYNKTTGAETSAVSFNNFFGGPGITGTPCDNENNGDPIVLYDQYAQRWFILDFAWDPSENDGSYYSIAVSKTANPTGDWWQYAFRADNTLMNDYPKCGIWHDGIYITANMFQFSGSYQHVKVWALNKTDLYSGTLNAQSLTDTSYEAFSLMPANAKGPTPPPSSAPCYFYAQDADEYGGSSIDAIYVWKMDVDWNNSNNTTWTGHSTMNTAAYGLTASGIPQPGTNWELDSLYGRLMFPAMYRNFGTHESLYLCHVAEYSNRRAMRWYEIRISGGNSSIYQQGTYSPDSHHRWMGAVGGDQYGNIAMGYSIASSSLYPSIRYCGRLSTDPLGQMSQGEATMIAGGGSQTQISRWGDYSSITIDPDDDETFWYTQEYYTTTGYDWQTRIGAFKFATTPPVPPDAPSGLSATASACDQIDLAWTDNADNETQFNIERGTDGVNFSQIDTVGADETTYSDTSVAELTAYYYRVRAYNTAGYSNYSNVDSATTPECTGTPPAAPTLRKPRRGRTYLLYKWRDNASDETGYRVYRGPSAGSLSLVATLPADSTQYRDNGLARRTTYYYKICAYNADGEGCSNVSSAKTK